MTDSLFAEWNTRLQEVLDRAKGTGLREPHAMTLATASPTGAPSARIVLLRGFDERGLVFYTNADSRKGHELKQNPQAALCFHWDELAEQIRVEGQVTTVSDEESDAYWNQRPRESRIGALASAQSQKLKDRIHLEKKIDELNEQYPSDEIPRPAEWYGFRIVPNRIEFWKNMPARLHDRDVYEHADDGWTHYKLYP